MSTEKTENPGERPMSMKERLQAQRRAEAEAAAQAPAVPPVPAAKPVARPATSAPRPAPAAAPAPAPAAAPAPRAPRASATPRAAPAAKPAAPRRDAKAMSADVQREVEMLRKRQDKWLMYGWIVAGVMILIAGGAYFYSQHKVKTREEAAAAYVKYMKDLQTEITGMTTFNSIDGANKLLARAEETKVTVRMPDGKLDTGWKETFVPEVTSKIASAVGKATTYIKSETTRNELVSGLSNLEAAIRDAANKKPEELAGLRRRLTEYESGGSAIGADFEARVSKARIELNRAIAQRMFDEARTVAAKGEARAGLNAYAKAEDELRSLMDEAHSKRNQDAISWVEPLYQQCIEESDKIAYAAFTPEIIEKTAWVDLLAPSEIKWQDDGLKGFRRENGQVQAIGSDPGSKREGVFSVGDYEYWRDYILEVEFVPVRGTTKLYWRLGLQASGAPHEQVIEANGADGFKAGQTYTIQASLIGSRLVVDYSENSELEQLTIDPINWRRQRVGSFGGVLSEGAEFKITKLRVKVLRGGKPR